MPLTSAAAPTMKIEHIDRKDLETFIYEEHKTAFGVKGRHYDFASMSREQLEREAESIANAVDIAIAEEISQADRDLVKFKAQITSVIGAGAGNRITALRWMTSTETFYHRQCVEHWVWDQGILFTDYGRELVEELMEIVNFEEIE